ncbi:hypothetical protein SteCoe_19362 [Stentor coeruleus]|uniref:Uncharacterized protein n=1 Tax=Stentor coeruleus TaxID=5963 RepID=A0A1R2BUS0_9CILI|nr:hypothetical protein SteCoe_19362 [Stentor coeruleus]
MLLLVLLSIIQGKILPNNAHGHAVYPLSSNAAEVTDYYFYIITDRSAVAGDYLKIQFPGEYSNINLGSSSCMIGSLATTCAQEGTLTVSLTLSSFLSANTRYTIKVPKITNPSATSTSYFKVYFQYSVSSQIFSSNDAFSTLAILPIATSATGSYTSSISTAGKSSIYTFQMTLSTALISGSVFQFIFPEDFTFDSSSCQVVAYSNSQPAMIGDFKCVEEFGFLILEGLSEDLSVGKGISLQVTVTNPGYSLTAGSCNFVIKTMTAMSSIAYDKAVIANSQITEGSLVSPSISLFSSSSKWLSGSTPYTKTSFKTANIIKEGGSITIDYGTAITSSTCVSLTGIPKMADGTWTDCSISGNIATLSNFGTIASGTTIEILNQLTVASVANIIITTLDSSSRNIDKTTTPSITLSNDYTSVLSSLSSTVTLVSSRSGILTLTFTTTSANSINTIKVYFPTSIFPDSTPVCQVGGSTKTCVFSDTTLTISSVSTSCDTSCILSLDTSTTNSWSFPSLGSSDSNIIEVSIEAQYTGGSEYGTLVLDIPLSEFEEAELVQITSQDAWSPYKFSLTLSNDLISPDAYILFEFTGFGSTSLGTGLSTGAFPCTLTGFADFSGTLPVTCTLTTDASTPSIKISSFSSIKTGESITATFLLKNPASTPVSVSIKAGYTAYNSLVTITDTIDFSQVLSAAAGTFTILTSSDTTEKAINTNTVIDVNIKPTSSSVANDYLFIVFPVGWNFNNLNTTLDGTDLIVTLYINSYAPSLLLSLSSNTLSSTSTSILEIQLENGSYEGSGQGKITLGLISSSTWGLVNYGIITDGVSDLTFSGAERAEFIYADYEVSNNHQDAGDVLYKFYMTLSSSIPSTGEFTINFDGSIDISNSYCTFSSHFGSTTTCSILGTVVTVSSFKPMAAGITVYIKVFNIINPSSITTGTLSISSFYSSDGTSYIDSSQLNATQLLSSEYISNTTISAYNFFPTSTGSIGELYLEFYMDTSVARTGVLTIIFPSGFNLPAITDSNCLFNLKFDSCASTGNTLRIYPVTAFSAGINMALIVPRITVPSNLTDPISITSTYSSVTLSHTSPDPDESAFFYASALNTVSFTPTVSFIPTNLAEVASYTFVILNAIETTDILIFWFPSEFPSNLGDFYCESSASSRIDQVIGCSQVHLYSIQSTGMSGSNITFTIHGINNPGSTGITSAIKIQIISVDNSVKASGQATVTITSAASNIQLISIDIVDNNIQALTNYTFLTEIPSLPSTIWLDFPKEFNNELYGLGHTFECYTYLIDKSSGLETEWASSATCVNSYKNRIVMSVSGSGATNNKYLKTLIVDVKSPSVVGYSNFFRVILLGSLNQVIGKNYDCNSNNQVLYTSKLQPIVMHNPLSRFTMNSGVTEMFFIYTAGDKIVAKDNIIISYEIISKNPISGIIINPSPIVLPQGYSKCYFTITLDYTVTDGVFIIEWSHSSEKYLQPKYSMIIVDSQKRYYISVKDVPEISQYVSSLPIVVLTSAAPISNIQINTQAPTGFTLTPIIIQAGSFYATYKISLNLNVTAGTYSISYALQGDNSGIFILDASSVTVVVNSYDQTAPSIVSFLINSPRHKTSISMTLQASESVYFFYAYGERSLVKPNNDTLITNASAGIDGFGVGTTDANYQYSFTINNLQGEKDYVLYGILTDTTGNFMDKVFTINLYTAEMDDSVTFTIKFESPYPSSEDITSKVIPALAKQFVITADRISLISASGSTAIFKLSSSVSTEDPSPVSIIRFLASPEEINNLLSGIVLSTDFHIDDTMEIIINERPTWYIYPFIESTTKDSVFVTFALVDDGTIHAEIIGDSETAPSSRQVVNKQTAFGLPASLTYEKVVTKEDEITIEFNGLNPTSSYTLVITAENNNDPDRYMKDELMAVIDFITQAGTVDNSTTNNTNSFGRRLTWMIGVLVISIL